MATAGVHVFAGDGTLLRTAQPLPTDFATDAGLGSIIVDGDGGIYYRMDRLDRRYLHLSHDGERVGFETLGLDRVSEVWLFRPGTRERWVLGYRTIHLVDDGGRAVRTIERRPDGNWLERVEEGAVAPNGALAVIATSQGLFGGPRAICVYAPDGDPVATLPLGPGFNFCRLAFDGSTVVVSAGDALYFHDLDGREPVRADLPGETGWWRPFVTQDGTEIWVHALGSRSLLRYKYR